MISSQLQSQFFSKNMTWDILISKYPTKIWRRTPPAELRIEVWSKCVYVHLPKSDRIQGFSLFISFLDYIDLFMLRVVMKQKGNVVERAANIYTVPSSQNEADLHTVLLTKNNVKCSCFLFKCLSNRINENKYLAQLLRSCTFFKGKVVCHHVQSVLNYCGFHTIQQFYEWIPREKARDEFHNL